MKSTSFEIPWKNGRLKVSENKRFLCHENGTPFFWLGDTGWLLFSKLDRAEAETYLEDRKEKGFNVIQVMVLHAIDEINTYGKSALINNNLAQPNIRKNKLTQETYDYWDHVDYIVDTAAEKGIYLAMVPIWGSVVKSGCVSLENAKLYGEWLASRYKNKPNVIWIIGGDIQGDVHKDIWITLGETIKRVDPNHLMTFHPFGRTQSSTWFHNEKWLDFNMFQSGHRRYNQVMKKQDEEDTNLWIGQDNWRYISSDYERIPAKPTIDGEPSYEGIPQGLHDTSQPCWNDDDCRRYAYWAVFAGAFGHTYGNNSVMQMHKLGYGTGAYGAEKNWAEAINDPGAGQMQFLKQLILAVPFFERIPDQSITNENEGEKYERLLATRGKDYIFVYDYIGRDFQINMGKITGERVRAWWYNPRNGAISFIEEFKNSGVKEFSAPGLSGEGNDWVLVVTDSTKDYF